MRLLLPILALLISIEAGAVTAATQLNIAFGASVPIDTTAQTLLEKHGPSRASGGEHILVKMVAAKMISDIKLTSYSSGHAGKTLIHSAVGINGSTKVALDGLSQFAKVTLGNPQNYQSLVMLPDTTFVEVTPNQAFSQIDIVVEGFTNDDASLLLQITSKEGLPVEDFLVTRTGPGGEIAGGLINETNYAKFALSDLQSLMSRAAEPSAADLVGKTFVCTSYTKLNPLQLNFKKRTYFSPSAGVVLSDSEIEGSNLNWLATKDGLEMTFDNFNGCGKFPTTNILRVTGAGNLISEVVLDLNLYIGLCTKAGYDPAATQAVETNSTFPSLINARFVVDSYEFCHLTN